MEVKLKKSAYEEIIFRTESAVLEYMKEFNIKKLRLYITNYVNDSGYSDWGYTIKNINSDYFFNQKCIKTKTKLFKFSGFPKILFTTNELCSNCLTEQEVREVKNKCVCCKEIIIACSMCNMKNCVNCIDGCNFILKN